MDSLFGVPLVSIMIGLLLLMGGVLGVVGWIAWRQPLLVRMGLRNIGRRRSQTILIVVGLMLSTLIISAAFATGDTVSYSVSNQMYEDLQEIDLVVGFREADQAPDFSEANFLAALEERLADDPAVDAISGSLARMLPVVAPEARLSEPGAMVVGIDPATVAPFGALLLAESGEVVSGEALGANDAYVTEALADTLEVGPGESVVVFVSNEPNEFRVIDVVRDTSATNPGAATGGPAAQAGGVVIPLETMRGLLGEPDGLSNIAISLTGGVRDSLEGTGDVRTRIEALIDEQPGSGAEVTMTKEDLIAIAEIVGSFFVTFFLVFGLFSMAAGILLIFLIFIMLAAERRAEMGMARAVGMKRTHLTETFIAEGMAYNLGSAAVGALLGVGVALLLITVLGQFAGEFGLNITFHVGAQGLVIAYAAGVVVTFATVAFSSWRAANLNIVRAIRDLPEPAALHSQTASVREMLLGSIGALWYIVWVAMVVLWGAATFGLFTFSLALYGLPFLAIFPVAGLYVFGARASSRGWGSVRGWWRRILYGLWWVLFNVLALITWSLFRTRAWAGRHRNAGGWALLMIIGGVLFLYLGGWVWGQAFAYTAGVTLAVLAVAMLTVYFGAAPRPAFTIASVAVLWYWLLPLPFSVMFEAGEGWADPVDGIVRLAGLPPPKEIEGNIEMFFVSGIAMTAAGTLLVVFNASALLAVVGALGRVLRGLGPAARTAIAYPLAARGRTGMTIAMFGLVVFSLVVMSFLNHNFTQLFLGPSAKAGFDVHAWSNPENRVPDLRAALAETDPAVLDDIEGIGTTVMAFPQMAEVGMEDDEDTRAFRVIGGDEAFYRLAKLPLAFRASGYETDEEVLAAIQSDPSLVVISQDMLRQPQAFGGDPNAAERFRVSQSSTELSRGPWEPIPIVLRDPATGAEREVRVIGVLDNQVTGLLFDLMGVYTTREAVEELTEGGEREDFYISAVDDSTETADRVAKGVESALLERGVQAQALQELINDATAQANAFQLLFQGFMGLGLIVGIAALGVIAFRTVVERRQQIGMLRAIGYTRRLVALAFFLESSFIALAGIGMGFVLGAALSYNLLTSPEFVGEAGADLEFSVPWLVLGMIALIAYGASALMTLIPARSASRVPVAEALRYE